MATIQESPTEFSLSYNKEGGKSYCKECSREFSTKRTFLLHFKRIHNRLRKFMCCYCEAKFSRKPSVIKHLSSQHEISTTDDAESSHFKEVAIVSDNVKEGYQTIKNHEVKCLECGISYSIVRLLRKHLSEEHNMDMSEQNFVFPNMDAFRKWKREIERKEMCFYQAQHKYRKTGKKVNGTYICHRSGILRNHNKIVTNRKRGLRLVKTNSCKLGVVCTSRIYTEERDSEVRVSYFPNHYGHGKNNHLMTLSVDLQTAIEENMTNGVSFENLVSDLRGPEVSDDFNVALVKKNERRYMINALKADEFHPGIEVMESIDQWVRSCCQMEDTPILYYTKGDSRYVERTFRLIIMTEFQKQILMTSQRQMVCVDVHKRIKGGCIFMCVLNVIDEYDVAFPVAFCFSNKLNRAILEQFFTSVKESAGCISCDYFMSNSDNFYYDAWLDVMGGEPKWLWNLWCVDLRFRRRVKEVFKNDAQKRFDVYTPMRKLMECHSEQIFQTLFKNLVASLRNSPESVRLADFIDANMTPNVELWAYCHRKDIRTTTNTELEISHCTIAFFRKVARRMRSDKFIFGIMKLVRYKMLDRLMHVKDPERIRLANEAIVSCHVTGVELPSECVTSVSDKIWLIRGQEADVYITREYESCPEHCDLRCTKCDICVHMYSCSCTQSLIHANLCPHIHAVVWKFLTPHFSPPPSPAMSVDDDGAAMSSCAGSDSEMSTATFSKRKSAAASNKDSGELLKDILKEMRNVYELITANKCSVSRENMLSILKKQKECVDICSGKPVKEVEKEKPEVSLGKKPLIATPFEIPQAVANQLKFLPFNKIPQTQINLPLNQYYLLLPSPTSSSVQKGNSSSK